ncbi:hypothetical protein [Flavobacterium sp. H122]|uniref:hypothetical protein n=1 Tax=Flavobacterium sp. H122 TaxID=2529860 RepID=UPI0010AA7855|nr:hypothetical protein [Flavobacterium sp. H122]
MKLLCSIFFALLISFSGEAQKKQNKKTNSTYKKKTEAVGVEVGPSGHLTAEIDTLHIAAGKPTVLLVDVSEYNVHREKDNTEEQELLNNFDKNKLQVKTITKHTFVIFENNQTLDMSDPKNSYQAKSYWSGKVKDEIQVEEGTPMATEFVAKQMKVKKESSYIVNARKYKKELASLKKSNPTEKSKIVMNAFLKRYSTPLMEEEDIAFGQNIDKIKTINVYVSEKKITKALVKTIEFNELGQPVTVIDKNVNGKKESERKFIYENGLLTKIIEGDISKTFTYNDDKMISVNKSEDGEITDSYWVENGVLFGKTYIVYNDDNYAYQNSVSETKFQDNCIVRTSNGKIIKKECYTKKDEFPFIYTNTSFQDNDIMQIYKSKITKKTETLYESYYSSSDDPKQYKDNFKLMGTFQLNEKKQVVAFNSSKILKGKPERTAKIEYTYYQ